MLKRAVRWRWITVNPLEQAEPPRSAKHDPNPPTSVQAAAILNASFSDLRWGTLLWLAMTTGARRGELCALRWDLLDLDQALLVIRTSIAQHGGKTWEKATKTHQRRIVLDDATVGLLRAYTVAVGTAHRAMAVLREDGSSMSGAADGPQGQPQAHRFVRGPSPTTCIR